MGSDAEWQKVRREWVRSNPPNHQDHYGCGICGKTVHKDEMELDHILPRSGSPELFSEHSNLQPSHGYCNYRKSSRRWEPKISPAEYKLRKDLDL